MASLAILLGRDYPYLGEWYVKDEPYPEQRAKAVHGAWMVCLVYLVFAVACGFIFSYHSFRAPGYSKVSS